MSNNETSPSLKTSPRPANRGRVLRVLTAVLVLALSATACAGTGRVQLVAAAEQPAPAPTAVAAQPGTETPGAGTPGTTNPGTETPGTTNPGTETPGTETPGTTNPGTPGTTNPGTETPGTTNPGTPGTTNPGTEEPTIPCELLPDLPWDEGDPSAPVLPSPDRPTVSIPCFGDIGIPDPGDIDIPDLGDIIPGPTPEPAPETVEMSLRPDTGIDGWAWSSNDTLVSWSNAHWRYNPTHYRVSTELASRGLAINENSAASAGGRRRFTPPQPNGLWLHIDADLSGAVFVTPAVGASSKVTVVARIQKIRTGQEPDVVEEIELYSYEVASTLDAIGDIALTRIITERLRINEELPPLEMGAQYHMELDLRCETKALYAGFAGGFCSFGMNELNDSWDVPVPSGEGLILNDAYLSYVKN